MTRERLAHIARHLDDTGLWAVSAGARRWTIVWEPDERYVIASGPSGVSATVYPMYEAALAAMHAEWAAAVEGER